MSDSDRPDLPPAGVAALLAVLVVLVDKHGPHAPSVPVLLPRLIEEFRTNLSAHPEHAETDDEAIETLALLERYLGLVENAVKALNRE